MKKLKLHELSKQYVDFNNYAEELLDNEEVTEDDLQTLIDTLDGIKDSIEVKGENICKFLKYLEGNIKLFKEEEERLEKRRKTMTNTYEGLKNYTKSMLELANINKIQAGIFTIRLQKNPPSSEVYNEEELPKEYKIPQPDKIDNKKILADLKLGIEVHGARLKAESKHLRIS